MANDQAGANKIECCSLLNEGKLTENQERENHRAEDSEVSAQVDSMPDLDMVMNKILTKARSTSVEILMTGKTGAGKSAIINAILGLEVGSDGAAKEGEAFEHHCTTKVVRHKTYKQGVEIVIWDSPGLQDGTNLDKDYLQQMLTHCPRPDLVVYCIKIIENRFVRGDDNPDVATMRKLTNAFGNEIWNKCIVVLTFANVVEALHPLWLGLAPEEKAVTHKEYILRWEKHVKNIMVKAVGIPEEIAKGIRVVPAGHTSQIHFPGYNYWLSNLWFEFLDTISTFDTKASLIQIGKTRLKLEDEVQGSDFNGPVTEQPIVVSKNNWEKLISIGAGAVGSTSAMMGASIGTAVGGFRGTIIGSVLGGAAGLLLSGGAGYFYRTNYTTSTPEKDEND